MQALVWRRRDFRESSRLVSFVTRERGLVTALAKGAHRPKSPMLGRIDWLDTVEIRLGRGDLPILHSVRLVHEPRALRQPVRFAAASWLGEAFDPAWIEGRVDRQLFDLTQGAFGLLERAPLELLPVFVLGLEHRYLVHLGLAPDLERCAECGARLVATEPAYPTGSQPVGLRCRAHRDSDERRSPLGPEPRAWLVRLTGLPAARWAELAAGAGADASGGLQRRPHPHLRAAAGALGVWLRSGLERRLRARDLAWSRVLGSAPGHATAAGDTASTDAAAGDAAAFP